MSEICPPDTPQDYLNYCNMLRSILAIFVTLCSVPLIGSFPMCTDGQPPLMEANDAFPCSRGCPRGFYCEMQDSLQTPILGVCCANRTELELLYGSDNKDHTDPIWNDDDVPSKRKPPALPLLKPEGSTNKSILVRIAPHESGTTTMNPKPSGSVRVIAIGVETIATTTPALSSSLEIPVEDEPVFETNSTLVPQGNNTLHVVISHNDLPEENAQPVVIPTSSETTSITVSPYDSANSDAELLLKVISKESVEATTRPAETNATVEVATVIENPVTEDTTTRPTDSTLPTPFDDLLQQENIAVENPISVSHHGNMVLPASSIVNTAAIEEELHDAEDITRVESPAITVSPKAQDSTEEILPEEKVIANSDEESLESFEEAVNFVPEQNSVLVKNEGFRKKDSPPKESASHESVLLEYLSKKEEEAQEINPEAATPSSAPIPNNLKVSNGNHNSTTDPLEEIFLPELVEVLKNDTKSDEITKHYVSNSTSSPTPDKSEANKENSDEKNISELLDIIMKSNRSEGMQITYSCDRQKYEFFCQSGNVRTQPKIRWYLNEHGECEYYPWGYCPGDRVIDSTTIRTKQECMRECLNSGSREKDIVDHSKDIHSQTGYKERQLEKNEWRQEDEIEHSEDKNDEAVGPFIPFPLDPKAGESGSDSSSKSTSFEEEPKASDNAEPQDTSMSWEGIVHDPNASNGKEASKQEDQKEVLDTSAMEEISTENNHDPGTKDENEKAQANEQNDGKDAATKQNDGKDAVTTPSHAFLGAEDEQTTSNQVKRPIQFDREPSQSIKYQYPQKLREQIQCTGTKYRYLCKNGMPSQFVYRWGIIAGKCSSFPYGYCLSEWNHPHPRTQEECEQYCLN